MTVTLITKFTRMARESWVKQSEEYSVSIKARHFLAGAYGFKPHSGQFINFVFILWTWTFEFEQNLFHLEKNSKLIMGVFEEFPLGVLYLIEYPQTSDFVCGFNI